MIPNESIQRSDLAIPAVASQKSPDKKTAEKVNALRLIIVSGTSSSGKSSVMSAFCKNQKNAIQLGIDDFSTEVFMPKLIRENLPEDYLVLKQVFEDRDLLEVCNPAASIVELLEMRPELLKAGSTEEQRGRAIQLLADRSNSSFTIRFMDAFHKNRAHADEEHFKTILEKFKDGKTVIFDTCVPGKFFEFLKDEKIQVEEKVQHILVYLPLNVLLERVQGRNAAAEASGNFANKRGLTDVMRSFKDHYKPIEQNGEVRVDVLKRGDILQLFDRYAEQIAEENRGRKEPFTKETLLGHFGFSEGIEEVGITTDFRIPQGILHSAAQSPSESAYQLRNSKFTKL